MTGTLLAWPATSALLVRADISPGAYLKKQLLIMVRGAALMAAVNVVYFRKLRTWAPAAYGLARRGWPPCSAPWGPPSAAGCEGGCQTRDEYLSHRDLLSVNFLAVRGSACRSGCLVHPAGRRRHGLGFCAIPGASSRLPAHGRAIVFQQPLLHLRKDKQQQAHGGHGQCQHEGLPDVHGHHLGLSGHGLL
jgi:hypothetical protein